MEHQVIIEMPRIAFVCTYTIKNLTWFYMRKLSAHSKISIDISDWTLELFWVMIVILVLIFIQGICDATSKLETSDATRLCQKIYSSRIFLFLWHSQEGSVLSKADNCHKSLNTSKEFTKQYPTNAFRYQWEKKSLIPETMYESPSV